MKVAEKRRIQGGKERGLEPYMQYGERLRDAANAVDGGVSGSSL
jgi:hypothetical protein